MTEIDGDVEGLLIPTPQSGEFSLYFHVPFCTRKCGYCHFYVIPNEERFHVLYMEALRKEWHLRAPLLKQGKLISIYFGGGTPSLLGPEKIATILSWIPYSLKGVEVTLEANPENVSPPLMEGYHQAGINRVSLGIQTFDDTLLPLLDRTHDAKKGGGAVETIYDSGIENISIDLMYDLPGQTLLSWERSLKRACELPITHLSLYNLTLEPHTAFFKKRATLQSQMPDSEVSLKMLQSAISTLETQGLSRYEISAFAKPGFYSRHNTGYWLGRPFLGFGPSAFSFWEGKRFRNIANLNRYHKADDPSDFIEELPPIESLKERLAIGLRLIQGIADQIWPAPIERGIQRLESEGWIVRKNKRLHLTEKGLLFHDTIAEKIMDFD